jgi:hypothetical protein
LKIVKIPKEKCDMKRKLLTLTLAGTMILGYGTGAFARTTHSTNHKYNHGKLQVTKAYKNGDKLYTQHNCKGKNGKFKKLSMCGK